VVAVILALTGFKYWSIVIASICGDSVMMVMLNLMRPKRIRFLVDTSIARQLFKFGGSLSLTGLLVFAIFNTDNFIVGAVAGATMLGYYVIAFNWGSMICTALGDVINSVLFPTFSRMQDTERIKASYLKVLEYVTFAGMLVNVTLLLVAREFLVGVIGSGTEKWIPALKALRILCFYGIIRFSLEPIGSVIMAIGRVNLLLKANIMAAVIELSLLYPALRLFGLEGVACVVTVAYVSQYVIYFPSLKKDIGLTYKDFFLSLKPALLSGLVVVGSILAMQSHLPVNVMSSLIIKVLLCTFLYCFTYGIITKWRLASEIRVLILNMRPSSS
jgi:O-antigen/teichoic acid export membrane protein